MTIPMQLATVAWLMLVTGYLCRRTPRVHVPLVLTGIMLDIGLVVTLQVTRDAVQKALGPDLGGWQRAHVGFSTCALLLYFPVMYLGMQLVRDPLSRLRATHRKVAITALILRTMGFVLMFSMWK